MFMIKNNKCKRLWKEIVLCFKAQLYDYNRVTKENWKDSFRVNGLLGEDFKP